MATLDRCRVTSFCAPPTVWRMLIQADLTQLATPPRKVVGAGEPLNPEVIEQVETAWGVQIRDGFGQTETTLQIGMVALNHILRPNLDYAIRWWYESWDEENFSADFNQPYMGAPSQDPSQAQSLYLGLDFRDYTNHILSVVLRYRY